MSTPTRERAIEVDALRGLALIGVCVMNYHGYLVQFGGDWPPRTFMDRVFDPWSGPLSTRFAAVFVTVAGISITLLTRRAVASGERQRISDARVTLVRRGVLLYSFFALGAGWARAATGAKKARTSWPDQARP